MDSVISIRTDSIIVLKIALIHCVPALWKWNQQLFFSKLLRSSHRACSVRKNVLRNFAKFTGKHLCQSLFFNKVGKPQACNFVKKETLAQVFSCEFCEISKNSFFAEHLWATASDCYHFIAIRIILLNNLKARDEDILKFSDYSLTNLLLFGESKLNNH